MRAPTVGAQGSDEMNSVIFAQEIYMLVATVVGLALMMSGDMEATMLKGGTLTDSMLLAWCLAGAVGAAACSVFMWPAKSTRESIGVFIGNTLFGWVFGPMTVQTLCESTERPITMSIALATSGVLAFAVSTALRPIGPILLDQLVKLSKTANWVGGISAALLRFFNLKVQEKEDKK